MTRLAWIAAAGLVAAGCEAPPDGPLPLVGTLERDRIELIAESNEPITAIHVVEGETVEAGQLLLELDRSLPAAELAAAEAARDNARARLAERVRGPREERIREARARLTGARDHLAIQRNELARIESLVDRGLASGADLDRARDAVTNAAADVDARTAALDELLEGTTSEELAQARAALAEAEARLESVRIRVERHAVTAPRDGRIEALPYERGERPPAGAAVVVMLADTAPYARVFVPEPLRARVVPGLDATVTIDGIDGALAARVRWVAADASFTPFYALTQRDRSRLAFVAEITLTGPEATGLPSGVPVQVGFPSLQ